MTLTQRIKAAALVAATALAAATAAPACTVTWTRLAATPAAPTYIPQGLMADRHGLVLSTYARSASPVVRFFRYADGNWRELAGDPGPLLHPSGLIPHGDRTIVIDYDSGLVALARFTRGSFALEHVRDTGEPKISSGFLTARSGKPYLVVSTFGFSGRHLWYDLDVLAAGRGPIRPDRSTRASAFVQGNATLGGLVLEAVNKIGRDEVNLLGRTASGLGVAKRLPFDGLMIEDLAAQGRQIFTTDEDSFDLWSATLPEGCLN